MHLIWKFKCYIFLQIYIKFMLIEKIYANWVNRVNKMKYQVGFKTDNWNKYSRYFWWKNAFKIFSGLCLLILRILILRIWWNIFQPKLFLFLLNNAWIFFFNFLTMGRSLTFSKYIEKVAVLPVWPWSKIEFILNFSIFKMKNTQICLDLLNSNNLWVFYINNLSNIWIFL